MTKKLIITAIALASIAIAFFSMKDSVRTYVSFEEAIASKRSVQILGILDKNIPIQHGNGFYVMHLKDKNGTSLKVRHRGTQPINIEHADSVVARGKFNPESDFFEAEKILVKCPSRYAKREYPNKANRK
ncbi:MAG: cytochrome c maturation protein CcmE [Spirochaetes bacterium]|nr:cytochrome c maturation protein CcmE [Spirochaetota bacterium]